MMLLISKAHGCQKIPEDFGYRHLKFKFQNDPVDVIIISKDNVQRLAKPIFFFCPENLPRPIITYDEKGLYDIFPFDENKFLDAFHIAIVGQPCIPVIAHVEKLGNNHDYFKDAEKQLPPKAFLERNSLDYYAYRNHFILKQLVKERWVCHGKVVVAGHGEGGSVAAKLASMNPKVTHLIYSGCNPYGKILDIVAASRRNQNDTVFQGNQVFQHWKNVVAHAWQTSENHKTTYSFSVPQSDSLMGMNIPILLTYDINGPSVAYHDLLRVEAIRQQKGHLAFLGFENVDGDLEDISTSWLEWLDFNL